METKVNAALTPAQKKVFRAIIQFMDQNHYPPTVREVADLAGNLSTSTVHAHMQKIRKKGYIGFISTKPRALWINERSETAYEQHSANHL
ncbi:LexA repressor [Jeotgalibacillus malaysiensis]|uniref:LexA family protein n=1 Tax=Jeotgalibacillus malaysiensis TaxID=1508404 RepID=UPI00384E213D